MEGHTPTSGIGAIILNSIAFTEVENLIQKALLHHPVEMPLRFFHLSSAGEVLLLPVSSILKTGPMEEVLISDSLSSHLQKLITHGKVTAKIGGGNEEAQG